MGTTSIVLLALLTLQIALTVVTSKNELWFAAGMSAMNIFWLAAHLVISFRVGL